MDTVLNALPPVSSVEECEELRLELCRLGHNRGRDVLNEPTDSMSLAQANGADENSIAIVMFEKLWDIGDDIVLSTFATFVAYLAWRDKKIQLSPSAAITSALLTMRDYIARKDSK